MQTLDLHFMRPMFNYNIFALSLSNHMFNTHICLYMSLNSCGPCHNSWEVFFYLHLRSNGFVVSVEFSTQFLKFYLLSLALSGFILYICLCAYYLSLPCPSASESRKAGSRCLIAVSSAPRRCSNMRKKRKSWGWGGGRIQLWGHWITLGMANIPSH